MYCVSIQTYMYKKTVLGAQGKSSLLKKHLKYQLLTGYKDRVERVREAQMTWGTVPRRRGKGSRRCCDKLFTFREGHARACYYTTITTTAAIVLYLCAVYLIHDCSTRQYQLAAVVARNSSIQLSLPLPSPLTEN